MRFGFSFIGLFFLVLLFVPNLLWAKNRPQGYDPGEENQILLAFERIGQVLVTVLSLCLADLNFHTWTAWSWWLVLAFLLMALYEGFWLRYFRGKHTLEDFYGAFCGVPVAGATLPVLAFFFLSIYGKSIWLLLSTLILGLGHIGIHLQHRKDLNLKHSKENNA